MKIERTTWTTFNLQHIAGRRQGAAGAMRVRRPSGPLRPRILLVEVIFSVVEICPDLGHLEIGCRPFLSWRLQGPKHLGGTGHNESEDL